MTNAHIAGLIATLHELPPKLQLIQQRKASIPNITTLQDVERWAAEYKTIIDQTVSDGYARIAMHADAILQLSDHERIKVLVGKLAKLTTAEISDHREAATHLETVSDMADFLGWTLKWAGGALGAVVRRQQIVALTAELENYFSSAA
jgi:hypothetical protein